MCSVGENSILTILQSSSPAVPIELVSFWWNLGDKNWLTEIEHQNWAAKFELNLENFI